MLVLSRKAGEKIMIGDDIEVTIIRSAGNRVKIGISAPDDVKILRTEYAEKLAEAANPAETVACDAEPAAPVRSTVPSGAAVR